MFTGGSAKKKLFATIPRVEMLNLPTKMYVLLEGALVSCYLGRGGGTLYSDTGKICEGHCPNRTRRTG